MLTQERVRGTTATEDTREDATDGMTLNLGKLKRRLVARRSSETSSEDFLGTAAGSRFGKSFFDLAAKRHQTKSSANKGDPPSAKAARTSGTGGKHSIVLGLVQAMEEANTKSIAALEMCKEDFRSLNANNLKVLCGSIEKRLNEKNVNMVCAEGLPDSEDRTVTGAALRERGQKAVCALREHNRKIASLSAFHNALLVKKGALPPTIEQWTSLLDDLNMASVETTTWPFEHVLKTYLETCIEEGAWLDVVSCLRAADDGALHQVALCTADEEKRAAIQQGVLTAMFLDLFKSKDNRRKAFDLAEKVVAAELVVDGEFKECIANLAQVFAVSSFVAPSESDGSKTEGDAEASAIPDPSEGVKAIKALKDPTSSPFAASWACYIVLVETDADVLKFARDCAMDDTTKIKMKRLQEIKLAGLGALTVDNIEATTKATDRIQ